MTWPFCRGCLEKQREIDDPDFYTQAARLKSQIIEVTHRDARHPAVQKVQDIFREHPDRL